MKEILKLYTESGNFNNKAEIQNEIDRIKQSDDGFNFEVIATYATRVNSLNVLVEIQVPSSVALVECGYVEMEMVAYTFHGEIKDYLAARKIDSKIFNEQWETAAEQMRKFANEVAKYD